MKPESDSNGRKTAPLAFSRLCPAHLYTSSRSNLCIAMSSSHQVAIPQGTAEKTHFSPLSEARTLRGGGCDVTQEDVINMNENLIPTLPEEYRVIATNVINFGWASLAHSSRWFFKKDSQDRIIGAVMNDLRDCYTRAFCPLSLLDEVLEEALDWHAEVIFFGSAPQYQTEVLKAVMARHAYTSPTGFESYAMIVMNDHERFVQAKHSRVSLPTGFVGDSLNHPADSAYINDSWAYRSSTSYIALAESIHSRPSACIRDPKRLGLQNHPEFALTNDLAGWEICRGDFSLGSLRVLDPYQGKGLGKWLSIELTSRILEQVPEPAFAHAVASPHPTPIAFVDVDNHASFKLHAGLGYDRMPNQLFSWVRWNRPGVHGDEMVA